MTQDLNAEPLTLSRLKRLKKGVSTIPVLQKLKTTRWSVLPVKWALWDQALGTQGPSLGHRQTKRRAFVARGVGI